MPINSYSTQEEPDVLDTAKETAVAQLEKYKNFMADENNATYKDGLPAIEKAITDIGKASSEEEVQTILDNAIKGVTEDTKKAMEDLEKERTDALASLQKYVDTLSEVEGLTEADKARVQSLVNEATGKVNAANSEKVVEDAMTACDNVLEAGFRDVALTKAVNEAVSALEAYKDSSKPGMNTYIDEQIKNIKDMLKDSTKKMSDVKNALSTAKKTADPLKKAQEDAYAKIQEYRDYVAKDTSLDATKKGLINGGLDTILKSVNDADLADEVTTALQGLDKFMATYPDVKAGVELESAKKELATKYQEYLVELAPYLASSSENVKPIAENAQASMKKIAEPEKDFTTAEEVNAALDKLKELYEEGKASKNAPTVGDDKYYKLSDLKDNDIKEDGSIMDNFVGYKTILEENDKIAKQNDKEDKEKLAATLKNAEETLVLYEKVLKDEAAIAELKLSSEDISNIQKWIDSTRTAINDATGASGVNSAMNLLNGDANSFLATYYPTYKKYTDSYDLSHAKTEVLAKLKELKEQYKDANKYYTDVKSTINTNISSLEECTTATEVRAKLQEVEKKIETAEKKEELEIAKQEAIDKLNEALLKVKDVPESEEVKSAIEALQNKITGLDYDGDKKLNTPADVEKEVNVAGEKIQELLQEVEDNRIQELNKVKTPILAVIDNYIEIAEAIEGNPVTSQLNRYRSAVSSAATQADLDKIFKPSDAALEASWTSEFYIYIKNQCEVLDAQYDALFKASTGLKVKEDYVNEKDQEKLSLINKAIEDIKVIKANTKAEATTEIGKITSKLEEDLGKVDNANETVAEAKNTATTAITEKIAKYRNAEFKTQLNRSVEGYINAIDAVTRADVNYQNTIDTNKQKALDIIDIKVAEFNKKVAEEAKKLENSQVINEGQIAGKDIGDVQNGEISISGSEGKFTVTGQLKAILADWEGLPEGITTKQGFFVCLKIKNELAGKIDLSLEGGDTSDVGIVNESTWTTDNYITVIVRVSETGSFNASSKKLKVTYYSDTAGEQGEVIATYDLSGLTQSE